MLLHRRLADPRIRNNSTYADIGILALLWVQIVVGMGTIWLTLGHMDGAKMLQFMAWSQSVMGLQINAWLDVVDVHWLYKLHIFLGHGDRGAVFPFTRLVHMLSVPIRYPVAARLPDRALAPGAKPRAPGSSPFGQQVTRVPGRTHPAGMKG
jgi:nitrate reductase gamma subunit